MQPDFLLENEKDVIKMHRQSTLGLGFCTLHFGILTEKLNSNVKSKSLLFKIAGSEPKKAGQKARVITLGLKMIRYGERMRLGFIKRIQILEKD